MSEEVKKENVETTETNTTQIIENDKAKEDVEASAKEEVVAEKKEEVKKEAPRTQERNSDRGSDRSSDSQQQRRGSGRPGRDFQGQQRFPKFKRKICKFCYEKNLKIDYKNSDVLEHFITDRGKILPRRVTGTCSKHQRLVARAIKRARLIALLPFVEQ